MSADNTLKYFLLFFFPENSVWQFMQSLHDMSIQVFWREKNEKTKQKNNHQIVICWIFSENGKCEKTTKVIKLEIIS